MYGHSSLVCISRGSSPHGSVASYEQSRSGYQLHRESESHILNFSPFQFNYTTWNLISSFVFSFVPASRRTSGHRFWLRWGIVGALTIGRIFPSPLGRILLFGFWSQRGLMLTVQARSVPSIAPLPSLQHLLNSNIYLTVSIQGGGVASTRVHFSQDHQNADWCWSQCQCPGWCLFIDFLPFLLLLSGYSQTSFSVS